MGKNRLASQHIDGNPKKEPKWNAGHKKHCNQNGEQFWWAY